MSYECIESCATIVSPVISTIAVVLSILFACRNSKEANNKIKVLKKGFSNEVAGINNITRSVILFLIHDFQEKGCSIHDELKHNYSLIKQDLDRLQQLISSNNIEDSECLYDNNFIKKFNEIEEQKEELYARIDSEYEVVCKLKEKYERLNKAFDSAIKFGDQTFKC